MKYVNVFDVILFLAIKGNMNYSFKSFISGTIASIVTIVVAILAETWKSPTLIINDFENQLSLLKLL